MTDPLDDEDYGDGDFCCAFHEWGDDDYEDDVYLGSFDDDDEEEVVQEVD